MATRSHRWEGKDLCYCPECLLQDTSLLDSSPSQMTAQVGSALPSAAIGCWGSLPRRWQPTVHRPVLLEPVGGRDGQVA